MVFGKTNQRRKTAMSPYCHLTIRERELIYLYQGLHFSIRRIAKALKRSPATISRELKRG
uniref:helix-turn-helix domain-containing protein n=1 Tax=Furfurilactobacillus entadae TaxID=2922307 RepID=UPI0038B2B832